MPGYQTAGDFGCCGLWSQGCGVGKGCVYGKYMEGTEAGHLMHAMEHCEVFNRLYIEKDPEFTKNWKYIPGQKPRQIKHATTTKSNQKEDLVDKLKNMPGVDVNQILKLLGL
jgi:hypothetical protein